LVERVEKSKVAEKYVKKYVNMKFRGPTRLAETHLAKCYNWPNTISRKPQLSDATIGQMKQLSEKILSHPEKNQNNF
jgi:hypothetical protein